MIRRCSTASSDKDKGAVVAGRSWAVAVAVVLGLLAAVADARSAPLVVPVPAPLTFAEGVRIGPAVVGGMDAAKAEAVVRAAYDQPLRFVFGGQRWQASPGQLGARPAVKSTVRRALGAEPWQTAVLRVRVVAVS